MSDLVGSLGAEIVKSQVENVVTGVQDNVGKVVGDIKEKAEKFSLNPLKMFQKNKDKDRNRSSSDSKDEKDETDGDKKDEKKEEKKEDKEDNRNFLEKLKDNIVNKVEEVTGLDLNKVHEEPKVAPEVVAQRKLARLNKFLPKTATNADLSEFKSGELGALTEKEQEDEEKQQKRLRDQEEAKRLAQEKEDQLAYEASKDKNYENLPEQKKKSAGEQFMEKKGHQQNFLIRDKFVKDEKEKSQSQIVWDEIVKFVRDRQGPYKDKRYGQIELIELHCRQGLRDRSESTGEIRQETVYFFFVETSDAKDHTTRHHVFVAPERPNESNPVLDFEIDIKKKRTFFQMFVDPIGNHFILSVTKEEGQPTLKHFYINVAAEKKKLDEQIKKATSKVIAVNVLSSKAEFELRTDVPRSEQESGMIRSDKKYHVITAVTWNMDEWFANAGANEQLESLYLGTADSKIFTAKQTDSPSAGNALSTNFVYDLVPVMKKDDVDILDRQYPTHKNPIPISGLEIFRIDSSIKNSQVSYIMLVSTVIVGFVFKSTQRVATKFFEDYYSHEKSNGKTPVFRNLKSDPNQYDIQNPCPVGQMCVFRTRRSLGRDKKAHLGKPYSYCWISDAGLVHGKILDDDETFFSPMNSTTIDTVPHVLSEKNEKSVSKRIQPTSICMTQFHIYVHYNLKNSSQIDVYLQPGELPTIKDPNSKDTTSNVVYNNFGDGYDLVTNLTDNFAAPNGGVILFVRQYRSLTIEKYAFGETFELNLKNPGLDIWRVYLERAQDPTCDPRDIPLFFFKAYILCNNNEDKNRVKSAEGDFFYSKKKYVEAGLAYSKTNRPFEEIVTKFINQGEGDSDGLRVYLEEIYKYETNLVNLSSLVVWLTQLHCDRICKYESLIKQKYDLECSEEEKAFKKKKKSDAIKSFEKAKSDFENFLKEPKFAQPNNVNIFEVCKEPVYDIIKKAGLNIEYLFLAKHVKDYEKLIQFRVYEGDYIGLMFGYRTLCKFCADPDESEKKEEKKEDQVGKREDVQAESRKRKNMWYKYLPLLMTDPTDQANYANEQKVSEVILKEFTENKTKNINLEPQKVVPALLQYLYPTSKIEENLEKKKREEVEKPQRTTQGRAMASTGSKPEERVLKYLNFCITDQKNRKSAVHNMKVLLLTTTSKSSNNLNELNQYLKGEGNEVYYTKEFAFRSCLQSRLYEACITLFNKMKLYENAVNIAIQNHNHVKAKDAILLVKDQDLKRRLLLKVLNFLIAFTPTNEQGEVLKEQSLENRKEAVKLLTDFPNDIYLEDIFKVLPDDTSLPTYLTDITKALKKYQNETEDLQSEMRESTNDSESIRNELVKTKSKEKDLHANDMCSKCGGGILYNPVAYYGPENEDKILVGSGRFYAFPCGHYYHMDCLCWLILELLEQKKPIVGSETVPDILLDLFEKQALWDKLDIDRAIESQLSISDYRKDFSDFCEMDEQTGRFKKKHNVQIPKSKAAKLKFKINQIKKMMKDAAENNEFAYEQLDQLIGKCCPLDNKMFVDLVQLPLAIDKEQEDGWSFATKKK